MMTPVRPLRRRVTARSSSRSVDGSSRDDASSRTTRPGSFRNTRANATSCASPADNPRPPAPSGVSSPAGRARSHSASPSSPKTSPRRWSVTVRSNTATLSRSVPWNSWTSWVTRPIRPRSASRPACRMSVPPRRTAPSVGSYRRNSSRAIVVLPEPVRPSSPSTSPGSTQQETSRRTGSDA